MTVGQKVMAVGVFELQSLTLTQRALRPVINWLVERYFPRGMFYGRGVHQLFADVEAYGGDLKGSLAVAGYLINVVAEAPAIGASLSVKGLTIDGKPHGDWSLEIARTDGIAKPGGR